MRSTSRRSSVRSRYRFSQTRSECVSGQKTFSSTLLQRDAVVAILWVSSSRSTDRTPLKVSDRTSGRSIWSLAPGLCAVPARPTPSSAAIAPNTQGNRHARIVQPSKAICGPRNRDWGTGDLGKNKPSGCHSRVERHPEGFPVLNAQSPKNYNPANRASLFVVLAMRLISHSIAACGGICWSPRRSV